MNRVILRTVCPALLLFPGGAAWGQGAGTAQPSAAPVMVAPFPNAPRTVPKPRPAIAKPRSTPARWRTNPGKLVSPTDYPRSALRDRRDGTSVLSLTIGVDGRVAQCSVIASSGHADLDTAACRSAVLRARFAPAQRQGEPVTGRLSVPVRWILPPGLTAAKKSASQTPSASRIVETITSKGPDGRWRCTVMR